MSRRRPVPTHPLVDSAEATKRIVIRLEAITDRLEGVYAQLVPLLTATETESRREDPHA